MTAGNNHSCGLRTNGVIECWGDNNVGQTIVSRGKYVAVSAGTWHSCGLRTNGVISC